MRSEQREAIRNHRARVAEISRNARASKAAPTGDRPDLWDGVEKPTEERSGIPNSHACGPMPVNTPMVTDQVERVEQPKAKLLERPTTVQGHLVGTSGIGMKTLPGAAPACGCQPIEWVDPKVKR